MITRWRPILAVVLALACSDAAGPPESSTLRFATGASGWSVAVVPDEARSRPGHSMQFDAVVLNPAGNTSGQSVEWSATGGTITRDGLYTAGLAAGEYAVVGMAKNAADTSVVTIAAGWDSLTVLPDGFVFRFTVGANGDTSWRTGLLSDSRFDTLWLEDTNSAPIWAIIWDGTRPLACDGGTGWREVMVTDRRYVCWAVGTEVWEASCRVEWTVDGDAVRFASDRATAECQVE